MLKKNCLMVLVLLGFILAQFNCCTVPYMIWSHKDISSSQVNDSTAEKKILIAARQSAFKEAIIAKIKESYQGQSIYLKFIGLDGLKQENATKYNAIVMMNTCMAKEVDPLVKSYLKANQDQHNFIVLTTSGDGNWLPGNKLGQFDAVSAASKMANVDEVTQTIITKINTLLQ
jgi:hypothetical protein